jgi:DNA polymerase-3 subunit chi
MQVDFYQLGRDPLVSVLASIATRVLASGGRLLVVTGDEAQANEIDQGLWTTSVESFLPHGLVGADQPILIAGSPEPLNAARNVAIVDGVWRNDALGFERAFHSSTIARSRPLVPRGAVSVVSRASSRVIGSKTKAAAGRRPPEAQNGILMVAITAFDGKPPTFL